MVLKEKFPENSCHFGDAVALTFVQWSVESLIYNYSKGKVNSL